MTDPDRPDEFSLISQYFAPLAAANPGALGLRDDAGLMVTRPGHEIVATVDTLVAGVHFRPDDPADLVARKLLRVNLSDLASMGARPMSYLLAASLSPEIDTAWLTAFVEGLAQDQEAFDIVLLGGDTTATPGPLSLTLTAMGEVPAGQALTRGGARPGDEIFVSGTIGDAALGLAVLKGAIDVPPAAGDRLAERFLLPRPRTALGQALRGVASAAADVSDGLVADLGHICEASGTGARVDAALVPLSPDARVLVDREPALLATVFTGGDDYELVFTASPDRADSVRSAARGAGVAVTRIGVISDRPPVEVRDAAGAVMSLARAGFRHF